MLGSREFGGAIEALDLDRTPPMHPSVSVVRTDAPPRLRA